MTRTKLKLIPNLPRTEFQCKICLNVYLKKDVNERSHSRKCKMSLGKSEAASPTGSLDHSGYKVRINSGMNLNVSDNRKER